MAGSLEGLHIRQTDLAFRVAEAFTMHSWVAKVQHAGKRHSNRVVVDLVYRKPVAMVEVKGGVYPVDVHGVFLPPAGFTADDAGRYPLISADGTSPIGPPGTAWGDERIAGAAKLADFLGPHWKQLGLTGSPPIRTTTPTWSPAPPTKCIPPRGRYLPGAAPRG